MHMVKKPYRLYGGKDTALNNFRSYIKKSLRRQILAGSLFSLGIGVLIFFACYLFSFAVLTHTVYSNAHGTMISEKITDELQDYITAHQVTEASVEELNNCTFSENGTCFFRLFSGDRLIYTYIPDEDFGEDFRDLASLYPTEGISLDDQIIHFSDGTPVHMALSYQTSFRPGIIAMYLSVIAGVIGFAICLYRLLRKKVFYIETLRSELDILAGGQLDYHVTVSGEDELSVLADGINQMKDTIIRRQDAEDEARKANHALVTSIAHDLRSPLTALIGYLEILHQKKYAVEKQADRFTELSLKKSFQIKDMSDKLFEYFFVYSADHDEQQIETLPANLFIQEALDDFTWSLENRGFSVERSECHLTGMLKINPDLLKRVFDNLYSNLLKYADPCAPVVIYCEENEQGLLLQVKNSILKSAAIKEGSRIGLATCERIAAFHNGSFSYKKTEDDFQAELRLPVF